jgi:hypothetical protein
MDGTCLASFDIKITFYQHAKERAKGGLPACKADDLTTICELIA